MKNASDGHCEVIRRFALLPLQLVVWFAVAFASQPSGRPKQTRERSDREAESNSWRR